ncbi:MAG: hypothetical protein WC866_06060 [Patescibacteria group bacterium]|jgi:hypothetical protein
MRKLAMLLMFTLFAAALHFGAMAGFRVMTELAAGHAAHTEHSMPLAPTCPVGSICPMISSPLLNLDKNAPLLALVLFVVLLAVIRLASLATFPLAYAGPPRSRPNNANTLLSVFKRE